LDVDQPTHLISFASELDHLATSGNKAFCEVLLDVIRQFGHQAIPATTLYADTLSPKQRMDYLRSNTAELDW